ncbi:conserved hypothetical protein [Solidesulfovibrio fructosivorans JJ]]|uniref:Uncharacterized protein n=1 Tax=Solidesulfovibrio fructosivorans JJ] TaxID=596151 RepID=E1JZA5_SOLFR|nr:hypothetical protein [Solidesulfovibrio fructosivorans]EFL50265.1 conserved hypothetical protein [Solidesulfovibrio fructosivorans JJ]]
MASHLSSAGRFLRVAVLCCTMLFSAVLPGVLRPAVCVAQDYEAMMPETLHRELRKAEHAYRDAIDKVNAAETERMARKAAGATTDELRALDEKVGDLVNKAEDLKIQADYIEELYQSKSKEYKNK